MTTSSRTGGSWVRLDSKPRPSLPLTRRLLTASVTPSHNEALRTSAGLVRKKPSRCPVASGPRSTIRARAIRSHAPSNTIPGAPHPSPASVRVRSRTSYPEEACDKLSPPPSHPPTLTHHLLLNIISPRLTTIPLSLLPAAIDVWMTALFLSHNQHPSHLPHIHAGVEIIDQYVTLWTGTPCLTGARGKMACGVALSTHLSRVPTTSPYNESLLLSPYALCI
ncbi:hypothetical protein BV22DRAFT_684283 [Leucogyrophana mollusca]|uniref:Uncharacterized protein n=1 Tax=Leucogyrophana mollusca TaxID=85980 RepID=A0ACB8B8U5_9AGAM|nr:hypothetical protein BV22DRAFT_684283 [Leucogyrophana mollusca]